MGELRQQ